MKYIINKLGFFAYSIGRFCGFITAKFKIGFSQFNSTDCPDFE